MMRLFNVLQKGMPLSKANMQQPLVDDETHMRLMSESFVDLLPVKQYVGDGVFMFRNGGMGSLLKIETINLEATTQAYKEDIASSVAFALRNAIRYEHNDFWLSQMFLVKKQSPNRIISKIAQHCESISKNNQFAKSYIKEVEDHIHSLANKDGAFIDKNTGESWSLSEVEVYFCFWQEKNNPQQDFDKMKEAIVRLEHTLSQAKLKTSRMDGQDYIDFTAGFFHDNTINHKTNILKILEEDLSEIAIDNIAIDVDDNGCFCFAKGNNKKYAAYMPLEYISANDADVKIGHLSAEQDNKLSLLDKLPPGTIWSQTTIYVGHDKVDEYLDKIDKRSMGDDAKSEANSFEAKAAKIRATKDYIVRFAAGVYLTNSLKPKLLQNLREIQSVFAANGLRMVEPNNNPLAQDDYIRSMPMAFNYKFDQNFFAKRSTLQHTSLIAALSPFYGRNTGTGTPGIIKFNGGGEPLMFDPVADKFKNAFGLLFGPSGTGKSAWLIEFLFNMMAIYKPKHVFIIEKGNSFGLFVDYCAQQGLTTNKVNIQPSSNNIHLPPFANATRLITDKNIDQERDLLGELLIVAQLMITGGEKKEEEKFERSDWDTVAEAIELAAQKTLNDGRDTTLTEDVVNALEELSKVDKLLDNEKERIRKMAKSMRVYINSAFNKRIFNTPGELFPEVDVTQLDVGIFGSDGYESQLVVAFVSLMNDVNRLAEANQNNRHPIFIFIDEAHLFTKHPLIISWILKMVKMWRKWGAWVWFATPSLDDYTESAAPMFKTIEWIVCLEIDKAEADDFARLKSINDEQKELIASMKGSSGQYKEGVVISSAVTALFRSVSMPLALALAMTESHEKAQRQKIMQDNNCTELEAVYIVAKKILESRGLKSE